MNTRVHERRAMTLLEVLIATLMVAGLGMAVYEGSILSTRGVATGRLTEVVRGPRAELLERSCQPYTDVPALLPRRRMSDAGDLSSGLAEAAMAAGPRPLRRRRCAAGGRVPRDRARGPQARGGAGRAGQPRARRPALRRAAGRLRRRAGRVGAARAGRAGAPHPGVQDGPERAHGARGAVDALDGVVPVELGGGRAQANGRFYKKSALEELERLRSLVPAARAPLGELAGRLRTIWKMR